MRHIFPAALAATILSLCLPLTACLDSDAQSSQAAQAAQSGQTMPVAQRIATVNLEQVMARSKAAEAGRAHLQAARTRLEQGYADLKKAWAKAPEKERAAVLRDGALALRRQMAAEEATVQNVVNALLLEEVKTWRRAHQAALVLAWQSALDAAENLDITDAVLKGMDAREAVFPALPVISVKQPDAKAAPAPAAPRNSDKKKR